MIIKQLSVFLENKSGRLTEVLETLGEQKIEIKALTVADTSEFGILRMIVNEPEEALHLLKRQGFSVNLTDVLSIATPTSSAMFAKALRFLSDENISIEYIYSFSVGDKEILIMRTDNTEKAIYVLQEHKMELVKASELYSF
ncbi:MAG: acetolactate synthase [Bacteroidota bacterium]